MSKEYVCDTTALAAGEMKSFIVNNEKIILFHLDDGFFATQSKCPHLSAPLEKGQIIDNCRIQCKFHRAEFDIKTGKAELWANFPPGIQALNFIRSQKDLKTYGVSIEEDKVYLAFE